MAGVEDPLAQKVSARFAKTGAARFHSHHDLMRFWERALRRAAWPVRRTAGFNPHPRLVFPHALGVGVASAVEEAEIELREIRPLPALARALAPTLEPTLRLVSLAPLPPSRKGKRVVECVYRIGGWPEAIDADRLAEAAAALWATREWMVERGPPRERTRLDARPWLAGVEAVEGSRSDGGPWVRATLRHTERGAGRVDETARALAARLDVEPESLDLEKIAMTLAE